MLSTFCSILRKQKSCQKLQRRCKSMKKKAFQTPAMSPARHALENFDIFYRPIYGKLWPSIRISLLSDSKYCAVVNNYADSKKTIERLLDRGAYNVLEAKKSLSASKVTDLETDSKDQSASEQESGSNFMKQFDLLKSLREPLDSDSDFNSAYKSDNVEELQEHDDRTDIDYLNLHKFMPAKRVYSEKDISLLEAAEESVQKPLIAGVNIVKNKPISFPSNLKVFTMKRGDIKSFPHPKPSHRGGLLDYFLMDAASLLPVLALDLQDNDTVLDLCAAPGGKSLSILQTGLPDHLICNDINNRRLQRLEDILRFYLPPMANVTLTNKDGIGYTGEIDKVLVDVPCNTDRHVLQEDGGDLFRPSRLQERTQLPTLQRNLLMSGIHACKPGGSVVYSTCTLSAAQNDGIIDATFNEVAESSDIRLEIEDLSCLVKHFRQTFTFYKHCRYGQLVIPQLSANFGPMYFCKINRLE